MAIHRVTALLSTMTLACLTLLIVGCGVDTPSASYQGYLTDPAGNPLPDGTYNVVYRLYNTLSGGTALYSQNGTIQVTAGLFNSSFQAQDVDTALLSQELWLETEVNGETLAPRQRLHGAPFAWTLVSGAVIAANEEITRTVAGVNDAGAGLIVGNVATGSGGGSGIIGVSLTENPEAAGVVGVSQSGYGGRFSSSDYRGLRTDTTNSSFYTAAFFGGLGIYVEGNCTGCRSAEIARNSGQSVIATGDFVAIEGVDTDADGNPVLQVRRATTAEDVIIGVAIGASGGPVTASASQPDQIAAEAAPGQYVAVGMSGLFQVRVADGVQVEPGDFITAGPDGAQPVPNLTTDPNTRTRVMSAPDPDGFVWVVIGG